MDKFGRYYAWFLLFVTAVPALLRLLQTQRVAELVNERMQDLKRRSRARMAGLGSVGGSLVLLPVYFLWSRQAWLVIASVVGVVTGVEMIGNAARSDMPGLIAQNRVFGWLYAATAVGIFVWLVRR